MRGPLGEAMSRRIYTIRNGRVYKNRSHRNLWLAGITLAGILLGYGLTREKTTAKAVVVEDVEFDVSPATTMVMVTAYTSRKTETDANPCIAADRTNICQRYAAGELICATGDRNVPFGVQIVVPGYGTCIVADRMNARFDGTGTVDVYFGRDVAAARQWGVRQLAIQVHDPRVAVANFE